MRLFFMAFEEDELLHTLVFGRPRDLEDGRSYLVKERKPDRGLRQFLRLMDRGYGGLYITRQHPDHVTKRLGSVRLRVVWLSTTLGPDYMDPHNLNSLTNLIGQFIRDHEKAVILLDGLEYLTINNDYGRILKFVEYLNEVVAQERAILLLSVDDRAFDSRQLALLERGALALD
jgi:hypothetical protein